MDREIAIEELGKDIASLIRQWQAIKEEARTEMDSQRKINLETRIDKIEREIEDKENKLKDLEKDDAQSNIDPANINQNYLDIEKQLAKFNFKSTVDVVEEVIEKFDMNNGSALFLLQDSIEMGGEYFSERLKVILRNRTREGNFKHCPIEFQVFCPTEEMEFLRRFSNYFPIDDILESTEEYTNQIIGKICESIPQSGYILFLEISGLEYLREKEKIMPWLVKDFWHNLATELQTKLTLKGYRKVRIICLMKTDEEQIPENCLPSYIYYTLFNLNASEVKELVIEHCLLKEVEDFLYTFGGFSDEKVKKMIELIYSTSNGGNPNLVYGRLKQILTQVN
jgi:hypothetical protein